MHKTIGLLGGLSPESTITYYQYITRAYRERHGDYSYPRIIIYSVNFQEFMDLMSRGRWDEIARRCADAMKSMHKAGAEFGLIATNTIHYVFDEVQRDSPIPLISIIDATAEAIKSGGLKKVGLLGTAITMSHPFYKEKLSREGIDVIVPDQDQQAYINKVIFEELARGITRKESRDNFVGIANGLREKGCEGVILGCTEIPILLRQEDCSVRLFDTCIIHAEKALRFAVGK